MMLLQRLKNLWFLSGTHIYSNTYNDVQLKIPKDIKPAQVNANTRKLATIIEMNKPDPFHVETD